MWQSILQIIGGGRWTDRLPPPVKRNLRWFSLDGIFASASESIVGAYLALFLLALGTSRAQIGLLSSLSSLSAALLLWPGAAAVERWGQRKRIVVWSSGVGARLALLLLTLVPLAFSGPAAVTIVLGLAVARGAFGNLSLPAWTSLTADIVPIQWRGRYFSARNIFMGIAGMVTLYLAGELITWLGDSVGYPMAMGVAFLIGLGATFSFSRLDESALTAAPVKETSGPRVSLWQSLSAQPAFLGFCAVAAVWNFSINIAAPFFNAYLVEELHASAVVVGLLSVAAGVAALPGQRLFGSLVDRWGSRRVQLVTGLLIPFVPACWALVRTPWHVTPINLASGFLWAGYNLALFNLLLTLTPAERRPRYIAFYQIVVTVALAVGAAVGGLIATHWGYNAIFILSGVGRMVAALLFIGLVRPRA